MHIHSVVWSILFHLAERLICISCVAFSLQRFQQFTDWTSLIPFILLTSQFDTFKLLLFEEKPLEMPENEMSLTQATICLFPVYESLKEATVNKSKPKLLVAQPHVVSGNRCMWKLLADVLAHTDLQKRGMQLVIFANTCLYSTRAAVTMQIFRRDFLSHNSHSQRLRPYISCHYLLPELKCVCVEPAGISPHLSLPIFFVFITLAGCFCPDFNSRTSVQSPRGSYVDSYISERLCICLWGVFKTWVGNIWKTILVTNRTLSWATWRLTNCIKIAIHASLRASR